MEDDRILDIDDWTTPQWVADLLGYSVRSMEATRAKGEAHPPWYKVGNRIRYRKSEVRAWLLSKRHVPAAEQLAQTETA